VSERPLVVDGVRGYYSVAGAGEPLVLLATTLVRARPYAPVIHKLASRFRVFALDLPGCGGAQRLPRTWSFQKYGRWLNGAIALLSLERVTLVGHSNSGAIALVAAATAPAGRLKRLVLADPVGAVESASYWRVLFGRAIDALLEPGLSLSGWHHLFYNTFAHTRNFFGQIKASIEQDVRHYAPRVPVRTLIAVGRPRPHHAPALRRGVASAAAPTPHPPLPHRQPRLDHHPRRRVRGGGRGGRRTDEGWAQPTASSTSRT